MKASAANLLTIIKGPKQFVIPIYQRTYSWQISQCNQLLKDILRISYDDSAPGHFIGSIVYFQESIHTQSDVPQLLVIDGQQRLTTISLLIAAIAEFMETNNVDVDTTPTKLRNYYLLNAEEDTELQFKLLLTRRDKVTLKHILKRSPVGENPSLRVTENFEFFKGRINIDNVVDIYNGVLRLFVVDVALEKDKDNPQLIFESLNSTGLDLSQADLIRNFVLMGQHIDIQTELYEKYWFPMEQSFGNEYASRFDWFIRDYLSAKTGKIPVIGRVYEDFKAYVQIGNATDIAMVVADIFQFSTYYVNFALHKEPDDDLDHLFKNISKLRVDVCYPFLLKVYDDYANQRLSKEEFAEVLSTIESYVFRRSVCGIPTNSLNKTFGTLYKSVRQDAYVESIQASLLLMDGYQRFPTDAEFESELITKDVYNLRSRNYLLGKLENAGRKEIVNVDGYTIEHIMPQNPDLSDEWRGLLGENWKDVQAKYLHTLGNLTLTGYNSELSDRSFSLKKGMVGGFDDSPIRLNAHLRRIAEWNEREILNRAQSLAEKARTVWQIPNLSAESLQKYIKVKQASAGSFTSLDGHEYLENEMKDVFEALRKRILNIDASVREEFKKKYVAYKSSTNFVDIIPQKSRLILSLSVPIADLIDPKGLARDTADIGRWGTGYVEIFVSTLLELEYAMDLIQQAFDVQTENV